MREKGEEIPGGMRFVMTLETEAEMNWIKLVMKRRKKVKSL